MAAEKVRPRAKKIIRCDHKKRGNLKLPNMGSHREKNTNKKTYHLWPHHAMWIVNKQEDYEMIKTGKYNISDSKYPIIWWKMMRKSFANALVTIITNNREEEYQEWFTEGSLWKWLIVMICIMNFIMANVHLLLFLIAILSTYITL